MPESINNNAQQNFSDFLNNHDAIRKAIDEYMATTEVYIIDRICRQTDLDVRIPLSDIEKTIVCSVYIAFLLQNTPSIMKNEDRDQLKAALTNLQEIPEIKRSERLSTDIQTALLRLQSKEEIDYLRDLDGILYDMLMLEQYYHYANM